MRVQIVIGRTLGGKSSIGYREQQGQKLELWRCYLLS